MSEIPNSSSLTFEEFKKWLSGNYDETLIGQTWELLNKVDCLNKDKKLLKESLQIYNPETLVEKYAFKRGILGSIFLWVKSAPPQQVTSQQGNIFFITTI